MFRRFMLLAALVLGLLGLAACDNAEERAQKHYETAVALLEKGDVDRAVIELKNALKLNERHKKARAAFAGIEEDRGNLQGAYRQYLHLAEQFPDDVIGHRAVARLAATLNNWDEAARHVAVARKLAPEDPVVQSVQAGLDYRNALRDNDSETADLAVKASNSLLEANPELTLSRQVVIDDLLRRQDWPGALAAIDEGLARFPDNMALYRLRLGVLNQLGREEDIVAQLRDMDARFPDQGVYRVLVGHLTEKGRIDEAEAFLRARVAQAPEDSGRQLELLSFLENSVSIEAALAEVEKLLAAGTGNTRLYRSVRATLTFRQGDREAAIAELETILKDAEPSEETSRIKIALARMQAVVGNTIAARARIEEVLQYDPSNVDALKLKANWLIDGDRPEDALIELRKVLDQAPRDVQALTLMAQAHERAGNRDLMGETLALAVEASGSAPAESLRYVQYLMQEEKYLSAEDVLQEALRVHNTDVALLAALGNVYVRQQDWPRTGGVIRRLQEIGGERANAAATELQARQLAGQQRSDDLEKFLSGIAGKDGGLQAAASVIRLRLAQHDVAGALEYVDGLLAREPDNPALRFIRAGVLVVDHKTAEAVTIYRDILKQYPQEQRVWTALYYLYRSRGEAEKASAVLAEAQAAMPENGTLKWIAAEEAEKRGDIDQAIGIYETLYERDSNSAVIANNLASLITTYRADDESLQRGYRIARRLRGTKVPAFQDTYGWIAFRLGKHEEALEYLEPAAKAISEDPTVQYHLAETYLALGRNADALQKYRDAVAAAEKRGGPRLPFMDRIEEQIAQLGAAGEN